MQTYWQEIIKECEKKTTVASYPNKYSQITGMIYNLILIFWKNRKGARNNLCTLKKKGVSFFILQSVGNS